MQNLITELAGLPSLTGTAAREDIFLKLKKTLNSLHLNWKELSRVMTDGARNMVERNVGVAACIDAEIKHLNKNPPMQLHCIIHQQVLCNQIMNWESVMNIVVPTVNLTRKSALNHHQFHKF
jgi:hypothetical protein